MGGGGLGKNHPGKRLGGATSSNFSRKRLRAGGLLSIFEKKEREEETTSRRKGKSRRGSREDKGHLEAAACPGSGERKERGMGKPR